MNSRYLRLRRKDGRVAVFHELHPDPYYCSDAEWELYKDGHAEHAFVQQLAARKLVVRDEAEDEAEYQAALSKLTRKHETAETLYLMTAQGCNLNCTYCFIPEFAAKVGQSMLSAQDAMAGIDLWYEHLKEVHDPAKPYFVIFYGGEPLLNPAAIEVSVRYLDGMRQRTGMPAQLNLLIVTNGARLDDAMAAFCKENGIMVAVSLDGTPSVHDAMRRDEAGNGSQAAAVRAIERLVAAGVRTFGSVTVGPHNLTELDRVSAMFKELGVEKFGINFIKGKKLVELVGQESVGNYHEQSAQAVLECSRHLEPGFEYQTEKKALAFTMQDAFPHDCTCYGSQLVIQPDGQVSNCPFFKAGFGHVREVGKSFRIWNQPLVKEWRKRLPLVHPGFEHNDAKALCGAGCAWSSQELSGDFLAIDDSSRIFSEKAFNELIWSMQ